MKKNLFFAAAAIAALASCSSDETLSVNENANFVDGDLVPVELGLSRNSVSVSQTRGTGTVGSTDTEGENKYNGEDLYVLMTTVAANNWGCTTVGSLGVQFDASFISRPEKTETTDEDGVWAINYLSYTNGQKKYYPVDGTYSDFFVFYVDDAATIKAVEEKSEENEEYDGGPFLDTENSTMTVNFTINGTQDLLAGKANNGSQIANSERTGFSAKTARSGLIPSIPMKHLLTRLTFDVKAGDKNADGIKIDSIAILSRSKGKLIVAYDEEGTKDPAELIEWKGEEEKKDTLYLYCDNATATDGSKSKLELKDELLTINWDEASQAAQKVGHAMFVEPNQKEYVLIVSYRMPYQAGNDIEDRYLPMTEKYKVRLGADQVLELGKSYNVVITVYGLSEIELTTTLEEWEDGGDIDIDTADPENSWQ